MTITLKFADKTQIDEIKAYFEEIYEFIDLDQEHIPASASINEEDGEIIIYMTDSFFRYTYQFFLDRTILSTISGGPLQENMETVAKNFRRGAEEMLMSNVVL